MSKAQELLQFVSQQFSGDLDGSQMDYYRQLEARIEQRRDRFNVEICIQASDKYHIESLLSLFLQYNLLVC